MKPTEASVVEYRGQHVVELLLEGNFLENDVYRNLTPREARELAAELLLAAKECEERISDETD
jgi:hypothetical protein